MLNLSSFKDFQGCGGTLLSAHHIMLHPVAYVLRHVYAVLSNGKQKLIKNVEPGIMDTELTNSTQIKNASKNYQVWFVIQTNIKIW